MRGRRNCVGAHLVCCRAACLAWWEAVNFRWACCRRSSSGSSFALPEAPSLMFITIRKWSRPCLSSPCALCLRSKFQFEGARTKEPPCTGGGAGRREVSGSCVTVFRRLLQTRNDNRRPPVPPSPPRSSPSFSFYVAMYWDGLRRRRPFRILQ